MVHKRWKMTLCGRLQGVGFRPFVWRLANRLSLSGLVRNQSQGVCIEVQGVVDRLEEFLTCLKQRMPHNAHIDSMHVEEMPLHAEKDRRCSCFEIVASHSPSALMLDALPDMAPCQDCLREMNDPANRRYLYPLISCTACGPRYSIQRCSPFDRRNTSLDVFPLCQQCHAEYSNPSDRRFHAQTIGCYGCGPSWVWIAKDTQRIEGRSAPSIALILDVCQRVLQTGGILLVKGVGGYQFICDAANRQATERLRRLKHRDRKPFALLVESKQIALRLVQLTSKSIEVLEQMHRPIVVGYRSSLESTLEYGTWISELGCSLGVMLPNSPIEHLIAKRFARPMVVTSANSQGEAMLLDDRQALALFASEVDAVLMHDREILQSLEDPVVRDTESGPIPIRLGRGDVPLRLTTGLKKMPDELKIALGADLKAAWAVATSEAIYLMQHLGDAADPQVLFRIQKSVGKVLEGKRSIGSLVVDSHPGYQTTLLGEKLAKDYSLPNAQIKCQRVQHHLAHLKALALDCQLDPQEPVLGFVMDGTGFGLDGSTWGGELLGIQGGGYSRLGHLRSVRLPIGDVAAKNPWRSALAMLLDAQIAIESHAGLRAWVSKSPWGELSQSKRSVLLTAAESSNLANPSSSMGRFLDGLASIIGLVHRNDYEGHAANLLEDRATKYYFDQLASNAKASDGRRDSMAYRFAIWDRPGVLEFDGRQVVQSVVEDLCEGMDQNRIAYRIHASIARMMVQVLERIEARWSCMRRVGLTGGVFQNRLLLDQLSELLEGAGWDVLLHRRIPPNDSGIAVGQLGLD